MSGQPIDANPTQSANKLKNIFEQAIQKKKEEAVKVYQPHIQKDVKPTPILKPSEPKPVQLNLTQNTSSLSTKTNISEAPSQSSIQIKPIPPPVSMQSNTIVQTGAISVKDRMKLFEQKKIISTKSDDVQIPLKPTPPPIMKPVQTEIKPIFVPPVQSPTQIPKIEKYQPVQLLQLPVQQKKENSVEIPAPIIIVSEKKQQTQSVGSVTSSGQASSKIKMWQQMSKNQKSNPSSQINSPVKVPNRMTYQPQAFQQSIPQRTSLQTGNFQTINLQHTVSSPPQVKQQIKNPKQNIIEPPKNVQTMSVKDRIKMMQNTLQNQAKQKQQQKNQPFISSPIPKPFVNKVQPFEPITIPSINTNPLMNTQKPIELQQPESLYKVLRVKNKRSMPNFDQI